MSRSKPETHNSESYVLDSFALIAWLRDEPGANTIQGFLERAAESRAKILVSWMNIAEVYYITKRRSIETDPQLAADKVVELLEQLPIQIEPVFKREAVAAARLKSDYVLSLADAFAAALAKTYDARLVTGDPEFESLDQNKEISVLWLPAKPKRR
jgi:predicted nucleic acid-binding protein